MRICVPLSVIALLLGASGGALESVGRPEPDLLIAAAAALADIEQLGVSLATHESPQIAQLVSLPSLQEKIARTLDEAGIACVEAGIGQVPRLVVEMEGVAVPQCDRYIYRVQTSLHRLVTFSDDLPRRVEAEVWRLRPRMELVAQADAGAAIRAAVLTQVEVFLGAHKAARTLHARPRAGEPNAPGSDALAQTKPSRQHRATASQDPFVASKSSAVFHRADCQWAQRIAETNRIGYKTREEALKDGKRQCKTCNP